MIVHVKRWWRDVTHPFVTLQTRIRTNGFITDGSAVEVLGKTITDADIRTAQARQLRYASLLTWLCDLPASYAPLVAQVIMEHWRHSSAILTRDEIAKAVVELCDRLIEARYVTCPHCGRSRRSLTPRGYIRAHNISIYKNQVGYRMPCPASGTPYTSPDQVKVPKALMSVPSIDG